MSKKKQVFLRSESNEREFLQDTLKWFQQMTAEEKRKTFVDAGIIDESGELTALYRRGSAHEERR
jgi:hypothetical protein